MRQVSFGNIARLAFVPLVLAVVVLVYLRHVDPSAPDDMPLAARVVEHDTAKTRAAFDGLYARGLWGKTAEGRGTSGTGSTLSATLLYRTFLQQFLTDKRITSVVDAGCGDWEFSQTINWTGIEYRGFDIVPAVIERNIERFTAPNIQFFEADIVKTDLPRADLLISKHVLQHLPDVSVHEFLEQIDKYPHVLLINGVHRTTLSANNADIGPGGYRYLDITKAPFNVKGDKVLTYRDDAGSMHQVVYIFHPKPRR
ncbi:MAG TPA: class I SAM-dependent methyltransferase [Kofleriaceae bacterium]|nr:class I SAM-dependent methyltransferase [Kofleriaceae bacterium]